MWQKACLFINPVIFDVLYNRVFNYFKHHVYCVSINSFIYYVSKNSFLEQHVVYVLDSRLSYFWHIIEYLEVFLKEPGK